MSTHTMGTTTFVVDGDSIGVHTPTDTFRTTLGELAEAALEEPAEEMVTVELDASWDSKEPVRKELPAADVRAFLGCRVAAARTAILENATDEELFIMGRDKEIRDWAQM